MININNFLASGKAKAANLKNGNVSFGSKMYRKDSHDKFERGPVFYRVFVDYDTTVKAAMEAFDEGDDAKAKNLFTQCAKVKPDSVVPFLALANIAVTEKDIKTAGKNTVQALLNVSKPVNGFTTSDKDYTIKTVKLLFSEIEKIKDATTKPEAKASFKAGLISYFDAGEVESEKEKELLLKCAWQSFETAKLFDVRDIIKYDRCIGVVAYELGDREKAKESLRLSKKCSQGELQDEVVKARMRMEEFYVQKVSSAAG